MSSPTGSGGGFPLAPVRGAVRGELAYFKAHPETPAMATDDNFVIYNPFVEMSQEDRRALRINESVRIEITRRNFQPTYGLTDQQRQTIAGWGGAYAEDENLARQTILARILSGDSSLGPYSPEQEAGAMAFLSAPRVKRTKR